MNGALAATNAAYNAEAASGCDPLGLFRGPIGDERSDVLGVGARHADACDQLSRRDHRAEIGTWNRFDVAGKDALLDVLFIRDHPGDLVEVHAVLVGEYASGPHSGGHRVGTDADPLALELLRIRDPRLGVDRERAVRELSYRKDRDRGEGLVVLLRGEVGGDRHL
jgi:hypothetical protein